MDFLEGVQKLHVEAEFPGPPPDTVAGQTGRAADLVRWYAQAYDDLQLERDGKWKWLRDDFAFNTAANTASYTPTAAGIATRFRSWDLDPRQPPFIYLVSDGQATEDELLIAEWSYFRRMYVRATHTASRPRCVSADTDDNLFLGPTPDGVYRVSGNFWKSNQALEVDDDEPEMPSDYHMVIVYQALTKYAQNGLRSEILNRAASEGARLFDALVLNQSYSRFSMSTAGPLA